MRFPPFAPRAQEMLHRLWRRSLSDYVTAIDWMPDGESFVAGSACGEVVHYVARTGEATILQAAQNKSIDAVAISHEGQWLAAAGQAGTVRLWRWNKESFTDFTQLAYPRVWIDRLRWNPGYPELAFNLGCYVQVWDAMFEDVVATLPFEASSVLDLAWHPQGDWLSVSGNQSIKTWCRSDWHADPHIRETGGASVAIAWSADGVYLASGNNDRSSLVWEWGNPAPWQMSGFPGKVRQLAWSSPLQPSAIPILASISGEGIVSWEKSTDPLIGWDAQILEQHLGTVLAIAFQPGSLLLASGAEDGLIYLWEQGKVVQRLQGASLGFSSLAWNSQGTMLAAGGQQGEVYLWKQQLQNKGFG
jgi:WD40 repeat protein